MDEQNNSANLTPTNQQPSVAPENLSTPITPTPIVGGLNNPEPAPMPQNSGPSPVIPSTPAPIQSPFPETAPKVANASGFSPAPKPQGDVYKAFNMTPSNPAPSMPTPAPVTPPMSVPVTPMPNFNKPIEPIAPVPSVQAPAPELNVRTMSSDTESLKTSGGLEASPKMFPMGDNGNEPVFNPSVVDLAQGEAPAHSSSGSLQKILLIILILVALGGIAFSIKQFILPMFKQAPVVIPVVTNPEPIPTPIPEPTPVVVEPIVITPRFVHVSFFKTVADKINEITLSTGFALDGIKSGFKSITKDEIVASTVQEFIFKDEGGPITFPTYLMTIWPNDWKEDIAKANFEDDFTSFVYYDKDSNPWPGFIAKVKTGVTDETTKTLGSTLETSTSLANLFVNEVGAFGKFDTGNLGSGKTVRFAKDAKLNKIEYGFFKKDSVTYWVVSGSYQGILEVVKRAGF